jgi:sec-independent protein translocase protein TatA
MDGLIILVVVALVLFGSTQIPKLARSLGSAKTEFKQGLSEGERAQPADSVAPVTTVTVAAGPVPAVTAVTGATGDIPGIHATSPANPR